MSFITNKRAKELGLSGKKIKLAMLTIGAQTQMIESTVYGVNIIDQDDKQYHVNAIGIEQISTAIRPINTQRISKIFKIKESELNRPNTGEVDMLVGLQYAAFHPVCEKVEGHLLLYKNQFGLTVGGSHTEIVEETVIDESCLQIQSAVVMHAQTIPESSFFDIESLGVTCVPRCGGCKCGKCHPEGRICLYKKKQSTR